MKTPTNPYVRGIYRVWSSDLTEADLCKWDGSRWLDLPTFNIGGCAPYVCLHRSPKPHVQKKGEHWSCTLDEGWYSAVGVGGTPSAAYKEWKRLSDANAKSRVQHVGQGGRMADRWDARGQGGQV